MTFTMTFNDGDFLEQIENIKRDESLCLITNKEKAFISKEKLEEKGFENYHFFELENGETCNKDLISIFIGLFFMTIGICILIHTIFSGFEFYKNSYD